jgi:LmbE family N-acetylglucosaminyl deacetylase
MSGPPAALHLSPHPDDELIGAPATLMALRDAGWRVVNLACGLGSRPEERGRRERELREACRLAGFELLLADADPAAGIAAAIEEIDPAVVLSPGPGDRHPAHMQVAALAREALESRGKAAPRWWMWALWGSLERPNLATPFDSSRLREIQDALSAHRQELRRNDYRRLVRGRSESAACLAPELLFGFGSEGERRPEFAEMLCEVVRADESWRLGSARWLDPRSPLPPATEIAVAALAHPAVAGEGGA